MLFVTITPNKNYKKNINIEPFSELSKTEYVQAVSNKSGMV